MWPGSHHDRDHHHPHHHHHHHHHHPIPSFACSGETGLSRIFWFRIRLRNVAELASRWFSTGLPRWCCLDGAATVVLPRWFATMVLPRWCCLDGAATMVLPWWFNAGLPLWCCHGGAASRTESSRSLFPVQEYTAGVYSWTENTLSKLVPNPGIHCCSLFLDWEHSAAELVPSSFLKKKCIYNIMQITMAGTFFMMRFWTHLMLFFKANHHGTKVFVKPFFSESTANHHGRSVFHVWMLSNFEAIIRSKSPAGSRGLCKYDASIT